MAEYIKREALLDSIGLIKLHFVTHGDNKSLFDIINEQPSANVAPVRHGRWLCVDTDTEQFFLCNRCKKKEYWESNYCPNCGCLMGGGDDE